MNTNFIEAKKSFPGYAPSAEKFRFLLEYARLAPSGHNTQPWLFRIHKDYMDLIADRRRGLPVVDPFDRELTISCGAILDHLIIAGRFFGYKLHVQTATVPGEDDVLARVTLGEKYKPTRNDTALFEAIGSRRTTRAKYEDRLLPEWLCSKCRKLAEQSGVELTLIADRDKQLQIAELVAEGDRIQFADREFRRELASWIHSYRGASHDGMSGEGFGMPDSLSPVGALVIRSFDIGNGVAAGDRDKIVDGSPVLALFSSPEDTRENWLATGRALSEILLEITAVGATGSYLNPPVEVAELRSQVKHVSGASGYPQLLLRFGFGPAVKQTVRRSVSEIVLN